MTVTPRDVPIDIEFVGTTESSHQVEIRARVEGFLEKRTYEEGGKVKAGQTMFQIDRRPFEAALQQARGALAQQEAKLTNAEATLKRVRPLAEKNAVNQKSSSFLMITGIYSPNDRYDENYVANYANLCILDAERNLFNIELIPTSRPAAICSTRLSTFTKQWKGDGLRRRGKRQTLNRTRGCSPSF